jgi:hypothetical protein
MHFWIMVALAYAIIMAVGFSIGVELNKRFPRKGGGTGLEPAPAPAGPSFGLPLGTDFDRMLLPDAFPSDSEVLH